jgi:hypothetical protein
MRLRPSMTRAREQGATAPLVAILLSTFVLTGMLAYAVESGNLMYERRQVQNGADAASLSLAQSCAEGSPACAPGDALTDDYTNDNAYDDESRVTEECAPSTLVPGFPDCTAGDLSTLSKCPPLPSWVTDLGVPYVEVHTGSETDGQPNARTWLTGLFGGGGSNPDVGSCARAAWGPPAPYGGTAPVTFSDCEWDTYTAGGTNYEPAPDDPADSPPGAPPGYDGIGQPAHPTNEIVILLQDHGGDNACTTSNGHDTSGGFGFLDDSGSCTSDVSDNDWVRIETGNQPCIDAVLNAKKGSVIDLPVFDCMVKSTSGAPDYQPDSTTPCDEPPGGTTWYHMLGWAKFYLSGWRLPSSSSPGYVLGANPCGSPEWCISGWFVSGVLQGADEIKEPPGSDSDKGAYAIQVAG